MMSRAPSAGILASGAAGARSAEWSRRVCDVVATIGPMLRFALHRRAPILHAALLLAWSTGCQVYDPTLVHRDAGGQGGMCEGRRPPPRPDVPDGDNVEERFFGLRDVVLDQEAGGAWQDMGFNLDGYCTGSPDFGHECEPGQRGTRPKPDGHDGIDNEFGADLFPLVGAVVVGLENTARAAQMAGNGLPVLRLRNWNGTPNDPRVHVTITQAVVTVPGTAEGNVPDIRIVDYKAENPDGTPAPAPVWDGSDYVWARSDTFLSNDPEQPLVYDDNAYVVDNQIVVKLPDRIEILFPADTTGVMVRLTGGIAVGQMSEDGLMLNDVVVAGRWSVLDLLRTAENVGVCMGTPEYNVLRARLAAIVDVRSEVGSGGPGIECDAVSVGVGFTGYRLKLAGLADGRPLMSACDVPPDGGAPDPDAGPTSSDSGPAPMDSGSSSMDAGVDGG